MTTLTQLQDLAVDEILALPEQGKRAASYGHTALNRNPRRLRGVRNRYQKKAAKLGYNPQQLAQQWQDILDVAKLKHAAEED